MVISHSLSKPRYPGGLPSGTQIWDNESVTQYWALVEYKVTLALLSVYMEHNVPHFRIINFPVPFKVTAIINLAAFYLWHFLEGLLYFLVFCRTLFLN